MTDDCGCDTPIHILAKCMYDCSKGDEDYPNSCGLFFLLKENKVLSTAMLEGSCKINFLWTPPKLRKMGYATHLLKAIALSWKKDTSVAPIWICADANAIKVCKKAGWVCEGTINADGCQDYSPKECFDRYMRKLNQKYEEGNATKSILDIIDFNMYFSSWRNLYARKRILSCRV